MKNTAWIKAGLIASGISIILQILGIIPCIKCLLFPIQCIAWLVIPLGNGYLAALWADLERDQLQEAATQGALAGIILAIVGGAVSFIFLILGSLLQVGSQSIISSLGESSEFLDIIPFTTFGVGTTIFFGCIGFFLGIVINVVLSTIGGIIRVALSKG